MFRRIADFNESWRSETGATLKVMCNLTDASLGQTVEQGGRTIARIAWHLVTATPEMMGRLGLHLDGVAEDAPPPSTAEEIVRAYEQTAGSLIPQLAGWTDATLDETVDMYGEQWTKGFTLFALVAHQIHHRGQLTVLMRQAGLRVPGIYGPAKEEWAAMGMPSQE